MNLIAADGEVWRKHRRVMGPAFNGKLYDLVWKETLDTYREMVSAEGWLGKSSVEIPAVQRLTFKPPRASNGRFTIQEALQIVTERNLLLSVLPKWARLRIPFFGMRRTMEAFDLMTEFMHSQVQERKREIHTKGEEDLESDVFTMLVRANEDEGSKLKLEDDELVSYALDFIDQKFKPHADIKIGNVWSLLFAGHETTAHTLAATIGHLAVHEVIQADVHKHIIDVIGDDPQPSPESYSKLEKVLAVFYEALRLYPAGHILIREASEDTVLDIPKPHGQEGNITIPVEKGVQVSLNFFRVGQSSNLYLPLKVIVDMVGVQYNPRYFDEPEKFKPSRWCGVPAESEIFSAFSIGARACLGRKFAIVESICFLTMLLRDYKVEPLLLPNETRDQWAKRVLDAKLVITLGIKDVPVRLVSRK
ncbi:hypothetical protein CVT24_001475 [Panaeolus cyanescens]|uniref:Cytochrome P450 n=1 Tax=Panaeolus cyanescens TaxID=181874 RepID=A0A409VTB3_9AGAR|nr:hypothetical protein CVT24_001475 [Panaeolus cyanescens]